MELNINNKKYFIERSGVNFNPLIELRMDWEKEMALSVKEVK